MNWGNKLFLALALFMTFILFLSTKMILSNNDELIDKAYYEKGLSYDKEYEAERLALKDSVMPAIEVDNEALTIKFKTPASFDLDCKYLPNAGKDCSYKGEIIENGIFSIPVSKLSKGTWQLTLGFAVQAKKYSIKRQIVIP